MCIGDSITLGSKGSSANTNVFGFRDDMQDLLGIQAYQFVGTKNNNTAVWNPVYQVPHEGVAGNTTAQILARLSAALAADLPLPNPPGSMVIVQGGINDIGQNVVEATTLSNLSTIISTINSWDPTLLIFVQTVLPSTNVTVNNKVISLNAGYSTTVANSSLSLGRGGIFIIDTNAYITANCPPFGSGSTCSADGTHPTDVGYAFLGAQITSCINNHAATNCNAGDSGVAFLGSNLTFGGSALTFTP